MESLAQFKIAQISRLVTNRLFRLSASLLAVLSFSAVLPPAVAAGGQGGRPAMKWADASRLGRPFSKDPCVIRFGDRYLMYFSLPPFDPQLAPTNAPRGWSIGIAESRDLRSWTKLTEELWPAQACDQNGLCAPGAIVLGEKVHLFYQTYGNGALDAICHATSDDGVHFTRDPSNPVFRPTGEWTAGRAIDAEVVPLDDQLLLYFASRDPGMQTQMIGVAAAPLTSDYDRASWRQLVDGPILKPELPWERRCIEAASVCRRGDTIFMFYAGGYNNEPQQIGVATSTDGLTWNRLSSEPFLSNGKLGSWNASESGHPGVFVDEDGDSTLFFQGNNDGGRTWFLASVPLEWSNGRPRLNESLTVFPMDSDQSLERTCFQTARPWDARWNLRSDVAIVYGIDEGLPERIASWRDRGYRIHVMTGVSWGEYQDYLYGRFDGINHEDEAQTVRDGRRSSHGGDVYYMCPGTNFGKFLCVGVQRALDAGAEAIHLEEPEFWVNSGYSEGYKREWQSYYGEPWQAPHRSVDAQWRASKLKYYLYRRALQQVFDHVQEYNRRTGRSVRCYVPTHSLLNYAHWEIVSPESSLARLNGCDGYIAQVWTGTARTPNVYRGLRRERTFETAFLEYGAMQNLVRATGRRVWYLNDPIEDNPNHDWEDYRRNWESTMVASLLQHEVWRFEVAPWPERIFRGRYPRSAPREERKRIPSAYATELQTVMNMLNDLNQSDVRWECGTAGIGVLVSDTLMFERGDPVTSDPDLSHVYGLALPLLKRGMPVAPVQLENVTLPDYLDGYRVLLLTYQGMKPLAPDVHGALAEWVVGGGVLVVVDDDSDPYNEVREWWNSAPLRFGTPREHLFDELGFDPVGGRREASDAAVTPIEWTHGKGSVLWLRVNPVVYASRAAGDVELCNVVQGAAGKAGLAWRETNHLLLRRGPYVIAAGLDESVSDSAKVLTGSYVDLFDPRLRLQTAVTIEPGDRYFLRDLTVVPDPQHPLLASACRAFQVAGEAERVSFVVEGVAATPGVVLMCAEQLPRAVTLGGKRVDDIEFSEGHKLLWVRFENEARPRELEVHWQ